MLGLAVLLFPGTAHAYTWMVRHGYTSCVPCHQDPSGGGILSPYGRSVGGLLLDSHLARQSDEGNTTGNFVFGAVELPPELMLGGDARLLWLGTKAEQTSVRHYLFLMQADAEAALRIGHFIASGSVGYVEDGGYASSLTRAPEKNAVSRLHWVGYEFDESSGFLVRAGRLNLPFGIRSVEHTLWARSITQTTVHDDQQHGVAVAWSPSPFRAELMAIAGNYQIRPDVYRERGYSGYLEYWPVPSLGVGVSSLITHRTLDPVYLAETWRHAHGVFGRWATPFHPLVLLAEADYVQRSPKGDLRRSGTAAYLQADLEPLAGVHFMLTGELQNVGVHGTRVSWGGWLSQVWFAVPHLDFRIDNIYQSVGDASGQAESLTLLAQAHLYL